MAKTMPANGGRSAVYGSGALYRGGQPVMDILRSSGFTTIILWSLHVDTSGDLYFNDDRIVSNGQYIGDKNWPGFVRTLRQQPTSVNRIELSVGAGGTQDWEHIQALIQRGGAGPDSILYRNFQVLYQTLGGLDAINDDDESCYDLASTVTFAQMAKSIGYRNFTIVPYTNPDFWRAVRNKLGQLMDRVYLQAYAGGTGNDPKQWASWMGMPVDPGLWCKNGAGCSDGDSPSDIKTAMAKWHQEAGIPGGFIWLYDDIEQCRSSTGFSAADYATAVNQATATPVKVGAGGR
jgi:hypothetical protein